MNWLARLLLGDRGEGHRDEQELREQVAEERARLNERKRRADRVLMDFRRAEAVIRGDVGSDR